LKGEPEYWGNQNYDTYVKAAAGTDAAQMAEKFEDAVERTAITPWTQEGMKDVEKAVKSIGITLQACR